MPSKQEREGLTPVLPLPQIGATRRSPYSEAKSPGQSSRIRSELPHSARMAAFLGFAARAAARCFDEWSGLLLGAATASSLGEDKRSGTKGFFQKTRFRNSGLTTKELFAVSSEYYISQT